MIPSFDLPVLAPPAPPAPQPDPVLRAEGPGQPFPELLAGLSATVAAPVVSEGEMQTGKVLPEPAEPDGNDLPDAPLLPMALINFLNALPLVQQAPQTGLAATQPQSEGPVLPKPDLPKATPVLTGITPTVEGLDLPLPANDAPGERVLKPTFDVQPMAHLAEVAAQAVRHHEAAPPLAATRETAPVTTASASPAPAPANPGIDLEHLVEQLAQAREAGRGARGELALRHAEFGTVAIRLEQADGETRATLAGRDPGFTPAVVAALAERAATGSFDQQHTPPHQRGGEPTFASGQGDARQPDRRGAPERLPAADPGPRDSEQSAEGETHHGRFA